MKHFNAWAIGKNSTKPFLMFSSIMAFLMLIANFSKAQSGCSTCALGYPDNSNLPRSAVVFNENDILRAIDPPSTHCGLTPTSIKLWYNDEHAMTLGIRRVNVKTASGTVSTDYPITAYPGTATCVT